MAKQDCNKNSEKVNAGVRKKLFRNSFNHLIMPPTADICMKALFLFFLVISNVQAKILILHLLECFMNRLDKFLKVSIYICTMMYIEEMYIGMYRQHTVLCKISPASNKRTRLYKMPAGSGGCTRYAVDYRSKW